ncbi:unnamed protein product [Nyctereutes procyonoides]|uniref:(raccoon dog) hypothetical protein n=1 Tax=Nyctereutes procyonoides TaxID=34880 RepID=A0A811ZKZ8_NYCPR|nr:unnamed protein product [Nyctereutes procyonoides]
MVSDGGGDGGGRAHSSDAGLAGLAPFYGILFLIKKLCVPRRPGLLFSPRLPAAPAPPRPRPRGCPRRARRSRLRRSLLGSPLRAPPPPSACPAPAPPLRPHPSAAAPGSAAQKQQRWRRQLRAPPQSRRPGTLGPAALRPRGTAESRARGHRGGCAGGRRPNPATAGAGPRVISILEDGRAKYPPHSAFLCNNHLGFTSAFNFYSWSCLPSSNFH